MTWVHPRGAIAVDPSIFQNCRTIVVGFTGQSMRGKYGDFPAYHPVSNEIYEFGPDGKIYPMTIDGGDLFDIGWGSIGRYSVLPYWADMLVRRGNCDKVIFGCLCQGGTTALAWSPYTNDIVLRAKLFIDKMLEYNIPIDLWHHVLGQGDNMAGTTQADFVAHTRWLIIQLRAWGYKNLFLLGQGNAHYGLSPVVNDAIEAGKHEAVFSSPGPNALGPNDDEWPNGVGWRVDHVHQSYNMRYHEFERQYCTFPIK